MPESPTMPQQCHECGTKRWLKRVKLYRFEPDHVCYRWVLACKRCRENEEWEGWPQGEDGRFLPSQECEVA
jgi:hypothetical protein